MKEIIVPENGLFFFRDAWVAATDDRQDVEGLPATDNWRKLIRQGLHRRPRNADFDYPNATLRISIIDEPEDGWGEEYLFTDAVNDYKFRLPCYDVDEWLKKWRDYHKIDIPVLFFASVTTVTNHNYPYTRDLDSIEFGKP